MTRTLPAVFAAWLLLLLGRTASAQAPTDRIVSLALGFQHTCVLFESGHVRCWGKDQVSGRGSGANLGDDEAPALGDDVGLGGKAVQISAGGGQTCALLTTGTVRCWGGNGLSDHWQKRSPPSATPAELGDLELGARVVEISAGTTHQCARTELGSVRCWGEGHYGELGNGSRRAVSFRSPALTRDVPLGKPVVSVVAGRFQSCALLGGSRVRCWGNEEPVDGPVKSLDDVYVARPASAYPVFDLGAPVRQISAGGSVCAVLRGGRVRCWGNNEHGQLGYGHRRAITSPASAGDVYLGGPALQITTGVEHACALLSEGRVRCWGRGSDGALGYGNGLDIGDDETPASAGDVPVGGRVVQLAAGAFHTCALLDTGKVRCWGDSRYGQLGYGNMQRVGDTETPAEVGDVRVFLSDPATPPPTPWLSRAPPLALPLLVESENKPPETRECADSCPGCQLLFDGARSQRTMQNLKPRPLSEAERALFAIAYRQYLESPICLDYDRAPALDYRAIFSAQDPARVRAVLDAAFSAPGRKQTLIVATVDDCGIGPGVWGRSLSVLLERGELVSINVLFGWDRAWARDLNGDGVAELIGLKRRLVNSDFGDITTLQVASYTGWAARSLAEIEAEADGCAYRQPHTSWQIWAARGSTDGALCLRSRESELSCPKRPP
ncbi:MAG TPA: hypothetical protein VFK05_00270 [Polyangiaceae bacterium]|nr:hypothetical protein [Polyangiaceae bacterium]